MLIRIPEVFTKDEVKTIRAKLDAAPWQDGKATAGAQSLTVKHNRQLPLTCPEARELGEIIVRTLYKNALFVSAALPKTILPPMFNRYGIGENFGVHVDNAIRVIPHTGEQMRADISMTVFFSEPEEYEGGELVVETLYGAQEVKLNAGDMVLYPSTSLHLVLPVTHGERISSFFWLQSMVRDNENRTMLFELDQAIQALAAEVGANHPQAVALTGIYHNLIRKWADL